MNDRYLEITFRDGRPFAAYLYLRADGARSARTESAGAGLVVDYAGDGTPIGLEITAPGHVSVEAINSVLDGIGQPRLTANESAPIWNTLQPSVKQELPLTEAQQRTIDTRLEEHRRDPTSALPLEQVKARIEPGSTPFS